MWSSVKLTWMIGVMRVNRSRNFVNKALLPIKNNICGLKLLYRDYWERSIPFSRGPLAEISLRSGWLPSSRISVASAGMEPIQ